MILVASDVAIVLASFYSSLRAQAQVEILPRILTRVPWLPPILSAIAARYPGRQFDGAPCSECFNKRFSLLQIFSGLHLVLSFYSDDAFVMRGPALKSRIIQKKTAVVRSKFHDATGSSEGISAPAPTESRLLQSRGSKPARRLWRHQRPRRQ